MRILNWNTQADKLRTGSDRFKRVRDRIAQYEPDIICLTEAYAGLMPTGGATVMSRPGNKGWQAPGGKRKVALWSRFGWRHVDDYGSSEMENGRFIRACPVVDGEEWTIIGVCIPWRDYPKIAPKAERTMELWQAACDFLDGLRKDILPAPSRTARTIVLGDFNLRIPPYRGYPPISSEVNAKRKAAFRGWLIPTSGIHRGFIDHIAMSTDLRVESMRFISKVEPDGQQLSDHNGVCVDVIST